MAAAWHSTTTGRTTEPKAATVTALGLAPADANESAIAISLPRGAYTAIVAGNGDTTGVGLIEVYVVR